MANELEAHLEAQTEASSGFFWHRLRWHAVQRCLPRRVPFGLLDVGAGAGLLGGYLTRDFPLARYGFIEPIDSLRERLVARYGEASDYSHRDAFAGVEFIALLDVLEHQAEDAAFLGDLASKMERGAHLVLTVPALSLLWSPWDERLGHFRRYTRGQLRPLLEAAGLVVEQLHYLFPELLPAALFRRMRGGGATQDSEFPALPRPLDEGLYALSRITFATRALNLWGTSLFAVARKP